tara:strand:+ start:251 stop:1219 length:969 start_codon:yes stop_codon:yes gene_type:complete
MNILIYEYILGEVITKKNAFLLNEAKIIISEKINNLSNKYPDSKTSILINKENQKLVKEGNIIYRDDNLNANSEILNLFHEFDKAFILAPEENNILYNIIKFLEEKKIPHLNCSSVFIQETCDKQKTNNLIKNKLPNTELMHNDYKKINEKEPIVAKTIDGLGADMLYIFKDRNDLENNKNFLTKKHIYQKFIKGQVAGVNIFSKDGIFEILSLNEQIYERKSANQIFLKEMRIGAFNDHIIDFKHIVQDILKGFTGYDGFFGMDFIISENKEIFFLEINPRLTTSYTFLRESIGFNPAELYNNVSSKFNIKENKKFSIIVS